MGRSNLRAKNPVGGYNIVTIGNGLATYEERNPLNNEQRKWAEVQLVKHNFGADTAHYWRPSYAVNKTSPNVVAKWTYQDNSDIGSGTAVTNEALVVTNAKGIVYALNKTTGKKLWSYRTNGKIYASAATQKNLVVTASTDQFIYCLNATNGKLIWKYETQKPIVANPLINNNTVYIGSSDHSFRALDLNTGKLKWEFDSVKGFVVTRPLLYRNKIYFGSWGTEFYCLDANTGALVWKWNNGSANRMFSPAACFAVGANGRIFIVAPDRYMTVFDAETGKVIWRKQDQKNRVRESMGLSADSSMVYAKNMDGDVIGVSTSANEMDIIWHSAADLNYEIAPTAIVEFLNTVYVPSDSGVITAVNRADGSILWKHKISNCLVTGITPLSKNKVVVSTMDGKIVCLEYR
jgi:outer membrane protein assembly factor BamB